MLLIYKDIFVVFQVSVHAYLLSLRISICCHYVINPAL
ncbi:hypothetical protein VIAE109791_07615 [Vibrio aestuarianus subsp. francensis]